MIHKFIKRRTLDSLMFAYVLGVRRALPAITISRSLELFQKEFNLTEEEMPVDSAMVVFHRMMQEYYDYMKESNK